MNKYSFENIKKIKWGVLEENNPISLYPVMYPGWCQIIEKTGKILGKPQKSIICLHRGKSGLIFVDHNEWNELGVYALKKMIKNSSWVVKLNNDILKYSDKLVDFTSRLIFRVDLSKKSNIELLTLYKKYEALHGDLYSRAIIPVYLELYKSNLTKFLENYLFGRILKLNYTKSSKECFTILTGVEKSSKIQLEEIAFLKLAEMINRNKKLKNIFLAKSVRIIKKQLKNKDIINHMNRYRYLGYNFEGPAFSDEYFIKRWKEVIIQKENIGAIVKKIADDKIDVKKSIAKVNNDLKIDDRHLKMFDIARQILYGKDYRKMSLVRSYYEVEPLLTEIGKRINLSLDQVRNCLLVEVEQMLKGKSKKPADLNLRMRSCLFVVVNGNLPGRVFTDKISFEMEKLLRKKEDYSELTYFHGQTASIGKAVGRAKIINSAKDLSKMKPGDILISQMTNPDLVPAMKIASAIITDLGGITCHASIVSRELKIPCIVNTKIATQVLRDGMMVEVDANSGVVRILK